MSNRTDADLSKVLWIGGSTFSGKTSVSTLLEERHGLGIYHCDDMFQEHCGKIDPNLHPTFNLIATKAADNVFMLPPEVLLAGVKALSREEFGMITDDLAGKSTDPIIAEGAPLLPECVKPLLTDNRKAVWLVATESFIRDGYVKAREQLIDSILAPYPDRDKALNNWMERDVAFAAWMKQETARLGLHAIEIDGSRDVNTIAGIAEEHLELKA